MKKVISMSMILAGMIVLCGCSHNAITYGDGINCETTINPQTYSIGFTLRYGKILSVICRENTKIKMNGKGNGTAGISGTATDNSNASSEGAVEIEIKNQVTGYLTDLAKVDKDLAGKIVDKMIQDASKEKASETVSNGNSGSSDTVK